MPYPRQLPPRIWGQEYIYMLDGVQYSNELYSNEVPSYAFKSSTVRGDWRVEPDKNIVWRLPTNRSASNMELTYIDGQYLDYGTDAFGREFIKSYHPYEPEGTSIYLADAYPYWYSDGTTGSEYNTQARADTEALLKLIDGSLQLGADIFEGKKTLNMIATNSARVFKAYKAAKRLNWGKAVKALGIDHKSFKKASKDVSGRWLELQYGWQPLMGSIHNGSELLKKWATETWFPFSVVRTVTVPVNITQPAGWSGTKQCIGTYSVRTKLWCRFNDPYLHMLSQLGLTNPASVAWELTPFSFVLDWLIPVGSFIEAWTATAGLEFLSGTRTTRHRGHVIFRQNSKDGNLTIDARAIYATSGYRREALTDWPLPQIYIKNPFSGKHLTNALALINQRWK